MYFENINFLKLSFLISQIFNIIPGLFWDPGNDSNKFKNPEIVKGCSSMRATTMLKCYKTKLFNDGCD